MSTWLSLIGAFLMVFELGQRVGNHDADSVEYTESDCRPLPQSFWLGYECMECTKDARERGIFYCEWDDADADK